MQWNHELEEVLLLGSIYCFNPLLLMFTSPNSILLVVSVIMSSVITKNQQTNDKRQENLGRDCKETRLGSQGIS